MTDAHASYIDLLSDKCGSTWSEIERARQHSRQTRDRLVNCISDYLQNFDLGADTDFVVFGSLARDEFTIGSDVDWTLLIDGAANPEHRIVAQNLAEALGAGAFQEPGTSGTFGSLAFSHDIIHKIGGDHDTNANMTQRVLLMLESDALSINTDEARDSAAYKRVLNQVFQRYIANELERGERSGRPFAPRFLINDLIRYWRTVCVDFAYKEHEQRGKKWAIRNIKLRFSRKLIFAAGLIMCYRVKSSFSDTSSVEEVQGELFDTSCMTPLEIISRFLLDNASTETASMLLKQYDRFLGMLNDKEKRTKLEQLDRQEAYKDEVFAEARRIGGEFQKSLDTLFFMEHNDLAKFVRGYGVF